MELDRLDSLLEILSRHGVQFFEDSDIKVRLGPVAEVAAEAPSAPAAREEPDPETGLTPSEAAEWFASSGSK